MGLGTVSSSQNVSRGRVRVCLARVCASRACMLRARVCFARVYAFRVFCRRANALECVSPRARVCACFVCFPFCARMRVSFLVADFPWSLNSNPCHVGSRSSSFLKLRFPPTPPRHDFKLFGHNLVGGFVRKRLRLGG